MRRLRLEHAKNALATSERAIADIALEAGFYDQSHFTAAFRRQFGMTPAEYRTRRIS
jgi:AraC-like DNA-binding protein